MMDCIRERGPRQRHPISSVHWACRIRDRVQGVPEWGSPSVRGIARAGCVSIFLIHLCGRVQIVLNPVVSVLYGRFWRLPWRLHAMLICIIRPLVDEVNEITFLLYLPDVLIAHATTPQRVPYEGMMCVGVPQTERVGSSYRIVAHVGIEIVTALCGILADEPSHGWVVVSGTVVIEACPIIFPARVLIGIRGCTTNGRIPKWLIGVLRYGAAASSHEGDGTTQGIAQKGTSSRSISPLEVLIHTKAGQHVCRRRSSHQLLDGIGSIVNIAGCRRTDGLAHTPPEWVIPEAYRHSTTDGYQSVSCVPRVCINAVRQ